MMIECLHNNTEVAANGWHVCTLCRRPLGRWCSGVYQEFEHDNNGDDVNYLARECFRISSEHGWQDGEDIPLGLALVHSEVSEALESWRKNEPLYFVDDDTGKPEGVGAELADVIIRSFGMLVGLGIDVREVIADKMNYNEKRPFKHGGKRA